MNKEKKRGKPTSKKMVKVYESVGMNPHTFDGSNIKRQCYYKVKQKIFTDLGFETKYIKKALTVRINKSWCPTTRIHMKYKNNDKRLSPIETSNHFHKGSVKNNFTPYNEPRNTFSDFVLDYTRGSLTYKSLLSIAKKMTPTIVGN